MALDYDLYLGYESDPVLLDAARLGVVLNGIKACTVVPVPVVHPPLRFGPDGEFRSHVSATFRMDPSVTDDDGLTGIRTVLDFARAVLGATNADVALIANGDTPVFIRTGGRLVLNSAWGWTALRKNRFPPSVEVARIEF